MMWHCVNFATACVVKNSKTKHNRTFPPWCETSEVSLRHLHGLFWFVPLCSAWQSGTHQMLLNMKSGRERKCRLSMARYTVRCRVAAAGRSRDVVLLGDARRFIQVVDARTTVSAYRAPRHFHLPSIFTIYNTYYTERATHNFIVPMQSWLSSHQWKGLETSTLPSAKSHQLVRHKLFFQNVAYPKVFD